MSKFVVHKTTLGANGPRIKGEKYIVFFLSKSNLNPYMKVMSQSCGEGVGSQTAGDGTKMSGCRQP